MSSPLTLIVLGQAYFIGTTPNIPLTTAPSSISPIPNIKNPLSQPLTARPVRRPDYTYIPDVGAYKVHNRAAIWKDAKRICEKEGSHLAIINSVVESEHITELFLASRATQIGSFHSYYAIIGFHERRDHNGYVTVLGEPLENAGYDRWAETEPNNLNGNEHCGSIDTGGGLNDINCENKYSFICELSDSFIGESLE